MENIFTPYHGKVVNLNIDDMKKNKPSLCDALVIMREMMCKLPKKFFLMRHSCKRDTRVKTLCV